MAEYARGGVCPWRSVPYNVCRRCAREASLPRQARAQVQLGMRRAGVHRHRLSPQADGLGRIAGPPCARRAARAMACACCFSCSEYNPVGYEANWTIEVKPLALAQFQDAHASRKEDALTDKTEVAACGASDIDALIERFEATQSSTTKGKGKGIAAAGGFYSPLRRGLVSNGGEGMRAPTSSRHAASFVFKART